ncbi:Glycosyl transferase family 2 [Parafrankia irregularis]|uniref:Glucosyl-3-phosphoglycerate synthase n=1 Tax=Parafrankia irregularis TaxID=795642 RepID=A0A0S4QIM7_9ACTN|nr:MULTISPECIES: glycosyltransferase [Parafrankia]MBE3205718.1 glycosyltransferase [Parafrankia sp. CH37]CUU55383.1 Glycosyl transferase family 2 [Parafrankia irregularis]
MADEPFIDPALGLTLVGHRSLADRTGPVSICIPAHNEAETITEVVSEARRAIGMLGADGEVIVAASACTDETVTLARAAGARVVEAGKGKGNAVKAALSEATGTVVATVDGDFRYFGSEPIAATLLRPIMAGIVDATIADLYWRPLYPQMWLYGFLAPLAGRIFPEMLSKVGATPWSGQRAAVRSLWPADLPDGFTVDLTLNLAWNDAQARVRPVPVDDWVNPQRPKPELLRQEFDIITAHGVTKGRILPGEVESLSSWFTQTQHRMATYRPDVDDVEEFEQMLLREGIRSIWPPDGTG